MAVVIEQGLASSAPTPAAALPAPLASATAVPLTLALGWQMSTLYAQATGSGRRSTIPRTPQEGLPGLVALGAGEKWDLLVRQISAKAIHLRSLYVAAALDPTEVTTFAARIEGLIGRWPAPTRSANGAAPDASRSPAEVLEQADAGVRMALAAAHARLGRAYGLGVELAAMAHPRAGTTASRAEFDARFRVGGGAVQDALADLASNLPAHGSRAVSLSLAQWSLWAQNPRLSGEKVVWPNEAVGVALCRQGEVWRTILTGEKAGRDMLTASGYLRALRCLVLRTVRSLRLVTWLTLVLSAALVALGVYFIVTAPSAWKAVSGVVLSILGAFGVTLASLKRALTGVSAEVGASMLAAELDLAIADAVTVAPGDWGVSLQDVDVPARGQDPAVTANARRLHDLRAAVHARAHRAQKVRQYLSDDCQLVDAHGSEGGGPALTRSGEENVADWLVQEAGLALAQVGIVAGTAGRLVSHEDAEACRFLVWTFRSGKVCSIAVADGRQHAWKLAGVVTETD